MRGFAFSMFSILWVTSAGVGLVGCDDGDDPDCTADPDCILPLSCIEGRCAPECRISADCEGSEVCFESVCYPPVSRCQVDEQCAPFSQVCDPTTERCVNPDGQNDAVVRPDRGIRDAGPLDRGRPIDMRPDDGRPLDMRPDNGRIVDMNPDQRVVDQGVGPDPDMGVPGVGEYGEDCRCGSDCVSGFCVENKLLGRRVCTSRCANDPACPGIDTCIPVQVSGGTGECPEVAGGPQPGEVIPVCIPNDTGFPCRLDAAQVPCNSGICLRPPVPAPWINVQDVCAAPCQDDRKCPVGFACQVVPGVDGQVCAPDVDVTSCPQGTLNECAGVCNVAAGDPLDSTLCLNIEANNGPGYCSCTCDDAVDCPRGQACSRGILDTGDPARAGICLLIAGYRCPQEVDDPDAMQCPSFTCATDDVPANSACTAPCVNNADCPVGLQCRNIDGATYCLAPE